MLNFTIESIVPQSFEVVSANFSEDLFRALAPSFPPSELLEFDGDRVGGLVRIKLGKGLLSKVWVSEIVSRVDHDDRIEFVDVGRELPPPLSKWQHKHIIQRHSNGETMIIDDISFSSGFRLMDYAMFPFMKAMFAMRTPAYKNYFEALVEK